MVILRLGWFGDVLEMDRAMAGARNAGTLGRVPHGRDRGRLAASAAR
ncbi:MAG TPA: hypothetical protein VIQ27_11420 [Gemmatimonadales bacterium]